MKCGYPELCASQGLQKKSSSQKGPRVFGRCSLAKKVTLLPSLARARLPPFPHLQKLIAPPIESEKNRASSSSSSSNGTKYFDDVIQEVAIHSVKVSERAKHSPPLITLPPPTNHLPPPPKVVLSPLGTGLLVIDIDWLHHQGTYHPYSQYLINNPFQKSNNAIGQSRHLAVSRQVQTSRGEPVARMDFPTKGRESRFRYRQRHSLASTKREHRRSQSHPGQVRIRNSPPPPNNNSPIKNCSLKNRLARAIYDDTPVSLSSIGNWLVHLIDESPSSPPIRIDRGQVKKRRDGGGK